MPAGIYVGMGRWDGARSSERRRSSSNGRREGIYAPSKETVELLRKYKRNGMTEETCRRAARSIEHYLAEKNREYDVTELEIKFRAENWVEVFRRLRVDGGGGGGDNDGR